MILAGTPAITTLDGNDLLTTKEKKDIFNQVYPKHFLISKSM
jgi:hypothetical protein